MDVLYIWIREFGHGWKYNLSVYRFPLRDEVILDFSKFYQVWPYIISNRLSIPCVILESLENISIPPPTSENSSKEEFHSSKEESISRHPTPKPIRVQLMLNFLFRSINNFLPSFLPSISVHTFLLPTPREKGKNLLPPPREKQSSTIVGKAMFRFESLSTTCSRGTRAHYQFPGQSRAGSWP